MKYHVTENWEGESLESAASRFGEEEAINIFCEKWGTDDTAYARDQINKIFVYGTIREAKNHQKNLGGQILEINDEFYEFDEDWTEGHAVLCTTMTIDADDIKVVGDV